MGERTAEEWGRIAVGLPGWRWMPGMRIGGEVSDRHKRVGDHWHMRSAMLDPRRAHAWPDPDDPATAGCLLALLLGPGVKHVIPTIHQRTGSASVEIDGASNLDMVTVRHLPSLGRACIAAAEALGRWPGGGTE